MKTHTTSATILALCLSILSAPEARSQDASWPLAPSRVQHTSFMQWARSAPQQGIAFQGDGPNYSNPYIFPVRLGPPAGPRTAPRPTAAQIARIKETVDLYFEKFGRDSVSSFMWTGFETGNSLTSDMSYRWDSLEEAGLYDREIRLKTARTLLSLGIRNIRFGLINHKIVPKGLKNLRPGQTWTIADVRDGWDDAAWKPYEEMIEDFSRLGFRISLDMHHFGTEGFFCEDSQGRYAPKTDARGEIVGECDREKHDPSRSFVLNPKWPDYYAIYALEAFKRLKGKIQAVTLINEPGIMSAFDAQLWHGGYPGWSSPQVTKFNTDRAIALGVAAVKGRMKIESYIASLPEAERRQARVVFLHTEGISRWQDGGDFNTTSRFMTDDMILGAPWLLETDFGAMASKTTDDLVNDYKAKPLQARTPLDHAIQGSVFWGQPEDQRERDERKQQLFSKLAHLQRLHRALHSRFGQTMQSYTIFGADYYSHNEDKDSSGRPLSKEPQDYAGEVSSGRRLGFQRVASDYFERYPIPMMITETGTAWFSYGARWATQLLAESAKLAESGIPFLGFTLYPAVDTWGWEHANSQPKRGSLYNPSGLIFMHAAPPAGADVPGYAPLQPKPFVPVLMEQLRRGMRP